MSAVARRCPRPNEYHGFHLTLHAVERFIQRHAPGTSVVDATRVLTEHLASAVHLRERSWNGDEVWHLPMLEVEMVVKRDRGRVITTVLPKREQTPEVVYESPPCASVFSENDVDGPTRSLVHNLRQKIDAQKSKLDALTSSEKALRCAVWFLTSRHSDPTVADVLGTIGELYPKARTQEWMERP